METARPIGIYYEHPDWFRPLFAELDRRGVTYEALDADRHTYDATNGDGSQYGLVFNRMSPSAYLRGRGHSILYTLNYLAHLEQLGVRVVNGLSAFRIETSKALQLSLLKSLGLPFPAARVINHPDAAPAAAKGLRFPVVVKANIGGSGAGIVRFDAQEDLERAVAEGRVRARARRHRARAGVHSRPRRPHHARRGARRRSTSTPSTSTAAARASTCARRTSARRATASSWRAARARSMRRRTTCASSAPIPTAEIIADVERIMRAADIDIGGVEYMIDDRDGQRYYYDINALSNFVADAPRVIGFDPFAKLADYLEKEVR